MGHENYKLEAYEKEMFLSISFMMSHTAKYKFGFNSALQKIEIIFLRNFNEYRELVIETKWHFIKTIWIMFHYFTELNLV